MGSFILPRGCHRDHALPGARDALLGLLPRARDPPLRHARLHARRLLHLRDAALLFGTPLPMLRSPRTCLLRELLIVGSIFKPLGFHPRLDVILVALGETPHDLVPQVLPRLPAQPRDLAAVVVVVVPGAERRRAPAGERRDGHNRE